MPPAAGKKRPVNTEVFEAGDKVLHDVFGMGKVLDARGDGPDREVDVDFGQTGKKRLKVRFAPMEKL